MLTYNEAFHQLQQALQPMYDAREAVAIADQYLTYLTNATRLDRIVQRDTLLTPEQQTQWQQAKDKLTKGAPLQYITGTTWFMNHEFHVNEHVLIPRPETEELVDWIIKDHKGHENIGILDIGTGSGCIAISLQLGLSSPTLTRTNDPLINSQRVVNTVSVHAFDISAHALAVAQKNADNLHADVSFHQLDFLDEQQWPTEKYNIIVSNPPYIPVSEQANMHTNVKDHEPELALFVPNEDPLLFYKAIARFGKNHLNPNGTIYCELHMEHAHQTGKLFTLMGYIDVEVKDDIHGNPRMLKASL